jgi:phosphatidyl-myo-inositol dimannoside synthase
MPQVGNLNPTRLEALAMRLLIVASEFPPGPGGISTHAQQLTNEFLALGWEVTVITSQHYAAPADIRAFNQAQAFPIISMRRLRGAPVKAAYRWWLTSRCVRRWQPDIVLASGDRDVYLCALLSKRYRLPWVAVEHGRIPPGWERSLKRWAFQQATSVVSVSRYSWQRLLELGVRPRSGRVITNGADAAKFQCLGPEKVVEFRSRAGLNRERILLTVGNVSDRKGQDVVIRALPRILKDVPDVDYFMIGLPNKEKQFARLAQQLGVAAHVHFLGPVDDAKLLGWLNCCDVFVMTSRHTAEEFEGFGIAVVEAALCGKPAIVSGNSGLAEAVLDGVSGLVVPEEDEQATADAILTLLQDADLRTEMGKAARKRAREQQTWTYCARQYDKLLRGLVQSDARLPTSQVAEKMPVP